MRQSYWGIDLGGTKIEGVVLPSATSTEPLCRLRIPTERDRGYDHVRSQIGLLVEQMSQKVGHSPASLGIGTPGVLDPRTLRLKNSNTTCLIEISASSSHYEYAYRFIVFNTCIDIFQPAVEPSEAFLVQDSVAPVDRLTKLDIADVRGAFTSHRNVVPRT